jgi:hypothetical protein
MLSPPFISLNTFRHAGACHACERESPASPGALVSRDIGPEIKISTVANLKEDLCWVLASLLAS